MKKLIVAVITVSLVATSGLALAQGWGRGPGMGYGPCGPGYGPRGPGYGPGAGGPGALNLTPEQKQKLQTLRDSFFKETIPVRNELMVKQLELRTLWAQTNPDQEKILAKQREINVLRAQMQEKATGYRLEGRKILTPEQQALWANRGWGGGFRGRGGCGPGMGRGMGMGMGLGPGERW